MVASQTPHCLPDFGPVEPGSAGPRLIPVPQPAREVRMAKRRQTRNRHRDKKSRASWGKGRDLSPASAVNLMIQIIALIRVFVDSLGQ